MKSFFQRMAALLLIFSILCPILPAKAVEENMAEDISSVDLIEKQTGFDTPRLLFDDVTIVPAQAADTVSLTLTDERGIGSLYLIFDVEYGAYTLTNHDSGETITLGETNLLHEYVLLEDCPKSITLSFTNGPVKLNEIYAFTQGEVPDFVQKWELPKDGETDLVLFSTHGDDEHLFFGGILPYYGAELNYQVQVVYLTNHRNLTKRRCHEMLNGLWAVGIRTYPVFGEFGDYFSTSGKQAYGYFRYHGVTEEELLSFVVEQLRRFKPKVAVGHDPINGEYGHGAHIVYAEMLMQASEISNDPQQFPELAEKYGTWDVPKTYLHLYPENQILLDWDQPLERFDGMTAYEVSKKLGFTCHETQYSDFRWYIAGMERAADIPRYSPREYGLYRTTVGEDAQKNDFFENVTTYAEDARIAEEARLEAERQEALRLEEEARQAEEARIREEEEKKAAALALQQQKARERMYIAASVAAVSLILLIIFVVRSIRKR